MALQPGQFTFKVVGPIGEGGLGIVDEIEIVATNQSHPLGTRLARKRLGPQWKGHPTARERFEREISTLRAMQHPNIISLEGINLDGQERFYCMPRCARSNRDLLSAATNGFEWTSVARLGITLAEALRYAHSLGFIHRDLKPENILLDTLNNTFVADWGVGYFIHQHSKVLKLTGAGLGTAYYCCLEQWSGTKAHPRLDVYSLGMTLAELVMGKQFYNFTIGTGIQADVVPQTSWGAGIFNSLLRQMTAMLPQNRVQDMAVVIAALKQAITASR